MNNINEYDEIKFKSKFVLTDLYKKIIDDFRPVGFSKHVDIRGTPRQIRYFSCVSFYYLQFILDKNPSKIYDIGCGNNIFKKYIPQIIGISPDPVDSDLYFGDICDVFDQDFVKNHYESFEAAFAINSLHFISLDQVKDRVMEFANTIKKNGIGFLALNLQRIIDHTPNESRLSSINEYDTYIRKELQSTGLSYKVFDIDFSTVDEYLDGNIRVVFEK